MVGDLTGGRLVERAQLILVGAILLAFLILSIVVVFNSAIHTQAAGQDGTVERAGEPPAVETEIMSGAREVVRAVNADRNTTVEKNESNDSINGEEEGEVEEVNESEDEGGENEENVSIPQAEDPEAIIEAVNGNLSVFDGHYQNATASSRPVLADLNLSANESAIGTIVHQREFGDLSGGDNRTVLNETGETYDVERFELALSASEFEALTVDLGDREIDLGRAGENITIIEDGETCELEPVAGTGGNRTITIDLLSGETDAVADEDCLTSLSLIEDEGFVAFTQGNEAIGTFELVVDAVPEEIESEVAFGPAVLSVEGDLTYESDELTYERQIEIDVYGDES